MVTAMKNRTLLVFALVASTVHANAVVLDFEEVNTGGSYADVGSPFVYTNAGGSGVDVSFEQGADLRVYDLVAFSNGHFPGPGRNALIDMDWGNYQNPSGTDILFSQDVQNFSLNAGDFGSDDDGPLRIEAFDAANTSLGVASAAWPASANPPFALLQLNVSGIRRVHYSSGGSYTGSTFIDNVTFTAVPEPGSMLALAAGCGLAYRRRRVAK